MIDIEKLKALAVAATKRRSVFEEIASLCDFQGAANPAAMLELIAEVERLTCELQNQREITQHWKASAGYISAPATGTVKDAEVLILLDTLDAHEIESLSCDNDGERHCECVRSQTKRVRAAIEAHNKAGKEQG